MNILIHRGDAALDKLDDAAFCSSWDQLAARCQWATVFQSRLFVDAWYRLHRALYEPIIAEGRGADGSLVGLLTLARRNGGRLLVGAGDFHAEYQVWLAGDDDGFIQPAIDSLAGLYPKARLRLFYMPATTPIGWVTASRGWPPAVHLRRMTHALIDLHDTSSIDRSLRKEHTRTKLERLRRIGPVELQQIVDVDELDAEFDTIADMCDVRQGAINHSLPFRANPLKRPLHLEMMRRGLLHVSVLRVGAEIASIHLDVVNGDEVLQYTMAYSPFFARESPGNLHILLLASDLARHGRARFDLSPGEGYKLRFGNIRREAHAITVFFDRVDRVRAEGGRRIASAGKRMLAVVGLTPAAAVEKVARVREVRPSSIGALARSWTSRQETTSILWLPPTDRSAAPSFRRNQLGDLLTFRPQGDRRPTIYGYLRLALARLEEGHWALTRMDEAGLAECWWVRGPATAQMPAKPGDGPADGPALGAGTLIYDWLPRADERHIGESLDRLRHDLARPEAGTLRGLLVAVPGRAGPLARLVQDRGAVPVGEIVVVGRRGTTKVRYVPAGEGAASVVLSDGVVRSLKACLPAFETWR